MPYITEIYVKQNKSQYLKFGNPTVVVHTKDNSITKNILGSTRPLKTKVLVLRKIWTYKLKNNNKEKHVQIARLGINTLYDGV